MWAWALVAVERWWCGCGYLSPSEGGGAGVSAHRHLKVVVQAWALVASGADVGPHRWLKVGCGYGRSSLFEGAGAGVGPRRC